MIAELNVGPEIFLALVFWNREWEWFHILCSGKKILVNKITFGFLNIWRPAGVTKECVCKYEKIGM